MLLAAWRRATSCAVGARAALAALRRELELGEVGEAWNLLLEELARLAKACSLGPAWAPIAGGSIRSQAPAAPRRASRHPSRDTRHGTP